MKLKRVSKGKRTTLPCFVVGKGSGGTTAESPENGFLISFNDKEWNYKAAFLSDRELAKFGFLNVGNSSEAVQSLVENLTKLKMQIILEEFDESKDAPRRFKRMNKTQLAKKIVEMVLSGYR